MIDTTELAALMRQGGALDEATVTAIARAIATAHECRLLDKLDALAVRLSSAHDHLDSRIDLLEARLDRLDTRLTRPEK